MSYGDATSLPLVAPGLTHWVNTSFDLITSENTSTGRFFDWNNGSAISSTKGLEIRNNNRIYVNSSNNTGNPTHVRVNNGNWSSDVAIAVGDTVNFSQDGVNVLATWVVQASQLWSSGGGGGTSTEGASVNSLYISSPYPWIAGTIADSEPTGSYPVTVNGSLVQGSLVVNPISHTTGTTTSFSFPIAYGGYGVWHLHQNYVSSALNTPIATVVVPEPSTRKKVHCNFW